MGTAIKVITFDLWDTLVDDDSDEAKRKSQGLLSKHDERRFLVCRAIRRDHDIGEDVVSRAYDVCEAAFNNLWKKHSINWTIAERIEVITNGLGIEILAAACEDLIEALGQMEVDIPPDPIPGVTEALEELSGRYRLCIVSDAIMTPGVKLRQLLDNHGLKRFFSGFAFSDEVGHSKPHPAMFESAAGQLGVNVNEMVHIGDRDHNDVKGPQALGMKAVLFTATRDVDKDNTTADAVCHRYADLPAIIDTLANR